MKNLRLFSMARWSFEVNLGALSVLRGFNVRTARVLLSALVFAFSALLHVSAAAAENTSRGTDFWVMFNSNHDEVPALTLFIAGDVATTGTVTGPNNFSAAFSVTPGTVTSVVVPSTTVVSTLDTVGNQGLHIVANAEVTVYGLNRVQFTTDAFLALPTPGLGTDYLVMAYSGFGGSQLGIVATQASTVVTITPASAAGSHAAGVPFNVTMGAGQTYQLRAEELTGTVVTSTKPIAVFGGHFCANVPVNVAACDHLVEQLPPTKAWGKAFLTMPLATRLNGDTFRILASTDGTVVSLNGSAVASLSRGKFFERIIAGPAQITATQPVLVAQYSNGSNYDGVVSDPFMMLIPPYEQFLAGYTVTTPATGFTTNFINIVTPTSATSSLRLDGQAIPAAAFTAIGSSGYSGAQRPVALGSHTLSSTLPFGAFVYGFASFDSYGYPGGLSLALVRDVTSVTVDPRVSFALLGTSSCVTGTARDISNLPVPAVRVDFTISGANPRVGFATTDTSGAAQYCYAGANLGVDAIVASVGTVSGTATKTWTALCDADRNGQIDLLDINLINSARNSIASTDDPRDANRDGLINILDARQCTLKCTKANCAR